MLPFSYAPSLSWQANSTALPSGRNDGQRCVRSFAESLVRTAGSPPKADTRMSPDVMSPVYTMVPSDPQVAPRMALALVTREGAPPSIRVFIRAPCDTKPTHSPSGEKNG